MHARTHAPDKLMQISGFKSLPVQFLLSFLNVSVHRLARTYWPYSHHVLCHRYCKSHRIFAGTFCLWDSRLGPNAVCMQKSFTEGSTLGGDKAKKRPSDFNVHHDAAHNYFLIKDSIVDFVIVVFQYDNSLTGLNAGWINYEIKSYGKLPFALINKLIQLF